MLHIILWLLQGLRPGADLSAMVLPQHPWDQQGQSICWKHLQDFYKGSAVAVPGVPKAWASWKYGVGDSIPHRMQQSSSGRGDL